MKGFEHARANAQETARRLARLGGTEWSAKPTTSASHPRSPLDQLWSSEGCVAFFGRPFELELAKCDNVQRRATSGDNMLSRSSRVARREPSVRGRAPPSAVDYSLDGISSKVSNASPLEPSPRPVIVRRPSHSTTRPSIHRVR